MTAYVQERKAEADRPSCSSLTAVEDNTHYRAYLIATCAGVYSLFPLLIKPAGERLSSREKDFTPG